MPGGISIEFTRGHLHRRSVDGLVDDARGDNPVGLRLAIGDHPHALVAYSLEEGDHLGGVRAPTALGFGLFHPAGPLLPRPVCDGICLSLSECYQPGLLRSHEHAPRPERGGRRQGREPLEAPGCRFERITRLTGRSRRVTRAFLGQFPGTTGCYGALLGTR